MKIANAPKAITTHPVGAFLDNPDFGRGSCMRSGDRRVGGLWSGLPHREQKAEPCATDAPHLEQKFGSLTIHSPRNTEFCDGY